jgi:hypothetical protein
MVLFPSFCEHSETDQRGQFCRCDLAFGNVVYTRMENARLRHGHLAQE